MAKAIDGILLSVIAALALALVQREVADRSPTAIAFAGG